MEIIDLPHDLFLLIVAHLSARATVRCRRVSRRWRDALTDQDFCLQLMKWHYPRCREMRLSYEKRRNEGEEGEGEDDRDMDWTAVLTTVARRYHHLCTAAPRSIDKIRINGTTAEHGFLGVGTWDRFLRLEEKEAPFHYPDPSWCYSQDDGVLVYRIHPKDVVVDKQVRAYYYPWRLLDLETGTTTEIPFPHDVNERIVRRVRMNDGVLVFEWCDKMAYHQLNDREQCHRHFVTALDAVLSPPRANNNTDSWTITERAEWKLHFLGFPLNQIDRFFSAHTATHYAVYVWQPNRSPWGEDDPIESVILWDISCTPPRIVRRITWPTLAFYCVRQRSTPKLRRIALDQHNLYFVEEEHRWAQGGHSSLSPPRGHSVCSTGIPVIPFLSSLNDRPPFVNNKNSAEKGEEREEEETIVQGPRWFDQCGADGDAKMSFCARLNFPSASSSLSSSSSSSSSTSERNRSPGIWDHHYPDPGTTIQNNKSSVLAQERENAARVATTRWPGWAPCWRHEEFPYLTVSEMVDFRAGVRITARHCFMLELLSVHVRPSLHLSVQSSLAPSPSPSRSSSSFSLSSSSTPPPPPPPTTNRNKPGPADIERRMKKKQRKQAQEDRGDDAAEVQFEDDMWHELLDGGYICGEERWLIGQDGQKRITIVRF